MNGRDSVAGPLLRIRGLTVEFRTRAPGRWTARRLRAVDGVDLELRGGQTLGLVGESGCGKSTLARAIVGLESPLTGSIELAGRDIVQCRGPELREARREVSLLFQDPYASLSPGMSVEEIVAEPLHIHRRYRHRGGRRQVTDTLELVGMGASHLPRYPHELSGGQRQRVGLARALVLRPRLLVLDEPVSALDVSIQAQIVTLLQETQRELGVAMLFISHDLAVVRAVADRVAVMYLGQIIEDGTRAEIYGQPAHPYTRSLLSAVPSPDADRRRDRIVLSGEVPDPENPPTACRFRTRCWKARPRCAEDPPRLAPRSPTHAVACHFPEPGPLGTAVAHATGREA